MPDFLRLLGIITCVTVFTSVAYANIASIYYAHQYYKQECGNPDILVSEPGTDSIASVGYIMELIDTINNNTTSNATDVTHNLDTLVSTTYLPETLEFISETSSTCCLGGYYNTDTGKCASCGVWRYESSEDCMVAGKYMKGTTCTACPDGWFCPAGTLGRNRCGAGYWCRDGIRTPCDGGVTQCPDDYHTSQPTE